MDKKTLITGGCSFTLGNELSDDVDGKTPSRKSWAYKIKPGWDGYICTAKGGIGNSAIARRVFNEIMNHKPHTIRVAVMWTFTSRYDWAMPRHKVLEDTRWASISPWSTSAMKSEVYKKLQGSEHQIDDWARQTNDAKKANVKPFAESLYKYAANDYHETYLSWKSIIWLQNILKYYKIPYFFTLADNTLFYNDLHHKKDQDKFMTKLYNEFDFTNWFSFGERMMGFNQWAWLNEYDRATTHPLDKAHEDAVHLMQDKWNEINNDDIKVVKMDKNPINPKTHMEQMTKLQKEIQDLKLQLNDSLQRTNSFKKMVKQMESDIGLIEQLNPNLRRKR